MMISCYGLKFREFLKNKITISISWEENICDIIAENFSAHMNLQSVKWLILLIFIISLLNRAKPQQSKPFNLWFLPPQEKKNPTVNMNLTCLPIFRNAPDF